MKTEITRFCDALLQHLHALPPALGDAASHLESCPELAPPLAVVNEVRARLRSLTDKLANQHTCLLLFGPLKSGKSTLMNAISGAYVSEVTSLPGYPALVFVQHAAEASFSVTRYNGRESIFADGHVLKDVIADSHVALAEQVRAAEARGEEFDPRRHFTEAVRRIDVKMPVGNLAESGTVLVDTPGLYSRMNFSYDMLTREFRDSASCAVFVVKTDNLFLEQVFAEFNQLLDLFSRIFLVVNVDAGKRDLQPDGKLAPSAESEDPQRIIEAFKTLSMAGPLRSAYEQGRVRIHAVDLMHAASAVLSRQRDDANAAAATAFDAFQQDLTDYLNSSDYTREFMRDSLRQSHTLCTEIAGTCAGVEMAALRERQAALGAELQALDDRLAALDRLQRVDWRGSFGEVRVANAQRVTRAAKNRATELGRSLHEALERWYANSDSLKALEHQHWTPLFRATGTALTEETVRHLREALATPVGGAMPMPETMIDLHAVGFDLAPVGRAALAALEMTDSADVYRIHIKPEAVPVKKSLGDWLTFRRAATVAERLFGEDRAEPIAPEVKQWRLPETSRAALQAVSEAAIAAKFPDQPAKSAEHLLEHYVEKFCLGVTEGLNSRREQTLRERAERREPFEKNARLLAAMQSLQDSAATVRGEVLDLAEKEHALPLVADEQGPLAFPASEPAAPTIVREEATA